MKLNKGAFSTTAKFGGSSVQVQFTTIPELNDGAVAPLYTPGSGSTEIEIEANATYAWAPFDRAGTDGHGMSLAGTVSDPRIADQLIPARFVSPYFVDVAEHQYVDVIVHPYPGTDDSDIDNDFTVYMYLNGGSPVQAVKRTISSGYLSGVDVYSASIPATLSSDVNEVRAVVMPRLGRPAILQCAKLFAHPKDSQLPYYDPLGGGPTDGSGDEFKETRNGCSGQYGNRGVLLVNYASVTLDGTTPTVSAAVTAAGHSRIKCDASMYSSVSRGEFEDAIWRTSSTAVQNTSDPYIVAPIVESGHFYATPDNTAVNAFGFCAKSCVFYQDPSKFPAGENVFVKNGSDYRDVLIQWEDCELKVEKDTSYSGASTTTTLGQSILADGFGKLLEAYDNGQTMQAFAYGIRNNSGVGLFFGLYGCTTRYVSVVADEVVGCTFVSPPPTNFDVVGPAGLAVKYESFGISKSMYPWGSVGADQINYDYDWSLCGTSGVSGLPNGGVLSPTSAAMTSAAEASKTSGLLTDALNRGVWPDFIRFVSSGTSGLNVAAFEAMYNPSNTEYVDHFGLAYAGAQGTWTKWARGGAYFGGSEDIHLDILHLYAVKPGSVIAHKVNSYGDGMVAQGVYVPKMRSDAIGAWDCEIVKGATSQKEISLGSAVLLNETSLDYNTGGNDSQFWGPGLRIIDNNGSLRSDVSIRSFITGDKSEIRGFSYCGGSFVDDPDTIYAASQITDDGVSRVIQGTAEADPNVSGTDQWWVVNLNR